MVSGPTWSQSRSLQSRQELGQSLFDETELNNPGSDFPQSCSGCHFLGKDPRTGEMRFYADSQERSLLPGFADAEPRRTLRNTPMLLDANRMQRYYYDGRFSSLEELIEAKLISPHFGWSADESERARDTIYQVLRSAMLVDYPDLFQKGYRIDIGSLGRDEAIRWLVRALVDYLDDIVSEQTSLWDAFADMNRIPLGTSSGETAKQYAGRVAGRIGNQEGRVLIKRPVGFSKEAYEGFKTFFRVEGEASVGNCVSCHVPPAFSDFDFHNTGIAASDFDRANGDDSFASLAIPGPEASRPSSTLLSDPRSGPGHADLGYWNFVDLDDPDSLREGESRGDALERRIGAFKTPSLRNLPRTGPYMHNGAFDSIEDAIADIVAINQLARAGKMRAIDDDYRVMNLSEADIGPLVAFLETFDEVDVEEFRELLINIEPD